MTNLEILQALVFEPRKAFTEIAQRPRFWFPLLVLAVATAGIAAWYTSIVDLEWLADRQLRTSPYARGMSEEQIAAAASAAGSQRGLRVGIAGIGYALVICVVLLIGALYYLLAGKVTGVERSFRQWFAFNGWTALPTALVALPAAFVLLMAETAQIPQDDLQALSLNALIFHRAVGEPGYALFTSLNPTQILSLALASLGIRIWTGKSWLFSILFATLPFLLIYGIWAWFALGRG